MALDINLARNISTWAFCLAVQPVYWDSSKDPQPCLPAANVGSFSEYAAVIVMSDHAESGRVWVEQLQNRKQLDPALANQPLLVIASAQAGPLLQPYVSSRQSNWNDQRSIRGREI